MSVYKYKMEAQLENIEGGIDFLLSKLNRANKESRIAIEAASREILANIIQYAKLEEKEGIDIELKVDNELITVMFRDKGKPFNPNTISDLDIEKNRGMGIFIARNMVDLYTYKFEEGMNISIIEKRG